MLPNVNVIFTQKKTAKLKDIFLFQLHLNYFKFCFWTADCRLHLFFSFRAKNESNQQDVFRPRGKRNKNGIKTRIESKTNKPTKQEKKQKRKGNKTTSDLDLDGSNTVLRWAQHQKLFSPKIWSKNKVRKAKVIFCPKNCLKDKVEKIKFYFSLHIC